MTYQGGVKLTPPQKKQSSKSSALLELNNMQKTWFLKIKYSLLGLGKDFMTLKDKELKDREVKIKREIEELF